MLLREKENKMTKIQQKSLLPLLLYLLTGSIVAPFSCFGLWIFMQQSKHRGTSLSINSDAYSELYKGIGPCASKGKFGLD